MEGTVTGIKDFGAFVLLPNGKTGLVHISEIASEYVKDVRDFVREQEVVRVKVLSCDERGRYALSIKQADPNYRPAPSRPRKRRQSGSFEERLARFLKESEENLSALKRQEGKRGGRGGRHSS